MNDVFAGQGRFKAPESVTIGAQVKTAPGVGCVNNRPESQGLAGAVRSPN